MAEAPFSSTLINASDTNRAAVEAAVEKYLGLPPLAAALISPPEFPIGVDAACVLDRSPPVPARRH